MSWIEILIALLVPTGIGLAVAAPFWWWRQILIGQAVGSGLAFAGTIFLIGMSYVTQQRENQLCAAGLVHCANRVNAHMPFLTYALIGVVDACVIFWIGLMIEERQAPKSWQPT